MPHPQHRIKAVSPPSTNASPSEREHTRSFLLRLLPLLLLMFYASSSVLKLASLSPSSSSSLMQPSDSFLTEVSKDLESLKTHISSDRNQLQRREEKLANASLPCSSLVDGGEVAVNGPESDPGVLCCDRSQFRTDVCYMRGDIRTHALSSSIHVYGARLGGEPPAPERIRPYTRKWEIGVMSTIEEISLLPLGPVGNASGSIACDVVHRDVPGVVFSTGGYTGNVYHEFNDGLLPLYITTRRFQGEVVLVVLQYHSWWFTKYRRLIQQLTNYKLVDFSEDGRVHCFSEMIVGLKIHGDLTIDPRLLPNGEGIRDFQKLLTQGLGGIKLHQQQGRPLSPPLGLLSPNHGDDRHALAAALTSRPKIAIFVRKQSRVLLNLRDIVKACYRIGFEVHILDPKSSTPLPEIYRMLASSDAMLAIHGAAMTHFLFMRPTSVLIQIVPLGLDWAAETYYGEPARRLGLEYIAYKVAPEESSLYKEYNHHDPIIMDPSIITKKGWGETKKIYLDKQNIRVDFKRFSKVLVRAHSHIMSHSIV